jgi:hypothetical protein
MLARDDCKSNIRCIAPLTGSFRELGGHPLAGVVKTKYPGVAANAAMQLHLHSSAQRSNHASFFVQLQSRYRLIKLV